MNLSFLLEVIMEETLTLKELFQALKKRLWLIALITVITATVSAVLTFFVLTPMYDVKTQLLVNQTKSEQQIYNTTELQANVQLINTYNVIIKSPTVLDKVRKNLNLERNADELNKQISVTSAEESQIVEIVVEDKSPEMAAKIANETAKVFKAEVSKVMNVDNVNILSKAVVKENINPVKPIPALNILIGIVIGLIISIATAFVLEFSDKSIKTEVDIEKYLDLPVMGVIANIEDIPVSSSRSSQVSNQASSRVRGESIGS